MTQNERRIYLIWELLKEQPKYRDIEIPHNEQEQKRLLRSLFNVRMPQAVSRIKLNIEYFHIPYRVKGKQRIRPHSTVFFRDHIFSFKSGDRSFPVVISIIAA